MSDLKYPFHVIFDKQGGRPNVTCTLCNLTIMRKSWMSDATWAMFQESFLNDHERPNHRRIEQHALHK